MAKRAAMAALIFFGGLLVGMSDLAGTRDEARAEAREPSVRGIGGVFLRARNPEELREWYRRHLGLEAGPQGADFLWRRHDEPDRVERTVWSVFPHDTDYFGASGQSFMINYIVDDLDGLLARLAESGIHPVKDPEEYPYGRFAWVQDGEGNRIELWEPPERAEEAPSEERRGAVDPGDR